MINLQHLVELVINSDGSHWVTLINNENPRVDPAYVQHLIDAINKINKQYN